MSQFGLIVESVLEKYKMRPNKNRPLVVALDGLSGAGKTTIVVKLKEELAPIHVVIIHIDDYIVEQSRRYHTGFEEWYEYYSLQWDVEQLKEALFEKLIGNASVLTLPFYDSNTDSIRKKEVFVPKNSIVVIEGIFLQRQEWQSYFDLTFYLDVQREIRYERALNRDTYIGSLEERRKKYKRRYWPAEDYYLNRLKPIENADVVIRY
ncbi:kinase [Sutcliffiella cohnii]|uniref:kinase n=1 Tax=Sutcliffiella cohnii TaxID=33932 RepID=UPI002E214DDF|nr:kinase [Sutcliffiella cohnii]MED4017155.1 kinase [Sutcliffiella cohnii]